MSGDLGIRGGLGTAIGTLDISGEDCNEYLGASALGSGVELEIALDHQSEAIDMWLSAFLTPRQAEALAQRLEQAASKARK